MKQIITERIVQMWCVAALSIGFVACDDGNLNTVIDQKEVSLSEYMTQNPNLRLFMNGILNYRKDLYLCLYGDDGQTRLTPSPIGKFGSSEGIGYGEITAVDIGPEPDGISTDKTRYLVFVADPASPCPNTFDWPSQEDVITWVMTADTYWLDEGQHQFTATSGILPTAKGGESWSICGPNGDESCDLYADADRSISGEGFRLITPTSSDLAAIKLRSFHPAYLPDPIADSDGNTTLCLDPDGPGDAASLSVGNYPIIYDDRHLDWLETPPLTEGVLHIHPGIVDCSTASIQDAAVSLELPTDSTFGPEGSDVVFDAGDSGVLMVLGIDNENVPSEARPRLIPVKFWF